MLKLFMFLSLILSGCATSSISTPVAPESNIIEVVEIKDLPFKVGSCFVKWSDPENRRKYFEGLGRSRLYRSEHDLLIPIWTNGGINIKTKISEDEYGIVYDISDDQGKAAVKKVMDSHFVYQQREEVDIMTRMSVLVFKISSSELHSQLQGYEEVNCFEFLSSQIL